MDNNVIKWPGLTLAELNAPNMLKNLANEEPDEAMVIFIKDDEISYCSSTGNIYKIVFCLEAYKKFLLEQGE